MSTFETREIRRPDDTPLSDYDQLLAMIDAGVYTGVTGAVRKAADELVRTRALWDTTLTDHSPHVSTSADEAGSGPDAVSHIHPAGSPVVTREVAVVQVA